MKVMALVILTLVACGTDELPAGAVCSATSECESGLECLDVAQINAGTCTVVGKACTHTCLTSPDCGDLGLGFMCFAGCGADRTCGATQ